MSLKRISILSSEDTRGWHSPFSHEMREYRRLRIIKRCTNEARNLGLTRLDIYDAFETLVYSGKVA